MNFSTDMKSCCIIEKINDDLMCTWAFPSISDKQRLFLYRKLNNVDNTESFIISRLSTIWSYIYVSSFKQTAKVKYCAIVLWSTEYDPEKYESLCKLLNETYKQSDSPVSLLKLYLNLRTISCEDYGKKQRITIVKELIKIFGLDIIIIYNALLLKLRLIVYHPDAKMLLKIMKTIPIFISHRNITSYLFPWAHLHSDELIDIKSCTNYAVGFTDSTSQSRIDLYDVFVHVPGKEITIASHAKVYMKMSSLHKETAYFLNQMIDNVNVTEDQIVTAIMNKTSEFLLILRELASNNKINGNPIIPLEDLKAKSHPIALENFLFNFAVAENMMLL